MEKVSVKIEGISPLLQHRFDVAPVQAKSKAKNIAKNEDNVEAYLYKDEDGNICQPASHIIAALKYAGARFQIPGQGKTTYKNIVGGGAVQVDPYYIPHENQKWVPDRQQVVVQKARIVRTRPRFDKWSLSFSIEYDEEEISRDTVNELLTYAGRRSGLGDYRPHKGGAFGRFIVTKFD
jgi:hypothetical protein